VIAGAALVIPQGLLDQLGGASPIEVAMHARSTEEVDRRAVAAVMAAERALGGQPEEMSHNNPGFDIRSVRPGGHVVRLEVKGRIEGADSFTITKNEVVTAKNLGDDYRLALVWVSRDGASHDVVRYLERPFDETDTDDFRTLSYNQSWKRTWAQGADPR
jgi:hypothetical protein